MSVAVALPFQTIPDTLVQFSGWEVGDVGSSLKPAMEILENWDYARDLEIATHLSVGWSDVTKYLEVLPSQLSLRVVLLAGTGTGRLPRRLERLQQVTLNERVTEARLSGVVRGARLSGQLRLLLTVALDRSPLTPGKLSPRTVGSRLWQNSHDILIEDGGASRFPIEAASFSKIFKNTPIASAPWYLHWEPAALQRDFSEQVRLYVNSDREEVLARFKAGDALTLQAILGDVVSQMVSTTLDRPGSEELLAQCEEGSVGDQVRLWISTAFPGEQFSSVRGLKDQFPGKYRALILGMTDPKVTT